MSRQGRGTSAGHVGGGVKDDRIAIMGALITCGLAILVLSLLVRPVDARFMASLALMAVILIPMVYFGSKGIGSDVRDVLVELIGKGGAFKTGEFTLEHRGDIARYVIYLSELFNKGQALEVAELMVELIRQSNVRFERVIGILMKEPSGGPYVSLERYHLVPVVASLLGKPYLLLYEAKDEETGAPCYLYDGEFRAGERAIIVDDVITTGTSIINAANHLRSRQIAVHDAFVFVSRSHGDALKRVRERLRQAGVTLQFIIDSSQLLQELYKKGFIGQEEVEEACCDPDFQDFDLSA